MQIKSVCMFCGVGCRLSYSIDDNKIETIMPDREDPVSRGRPCVKGLSINTINPDRVTSPMVRGSNGLEPVDWEYAIEMFSEKLKDIEPEKTGWIGSGEITNEDNYAISKFAREFGSENVDSCARLCHAPTVKGFKEVIGVGCSPGKLDDIYKLDTLLLVGTNPMVTYPAMGARIMEQKSKGKLNVLYVSFWEDETSSVADHIALMDMNHVSFFLLAIIDELINRGLASDIPGFDKLVGSAREARPIYKKILDMDKVREFAEEIEKSKSFGIAHGMGVTQTYNGTATIKAVASLALLKNGRIITNRGKINIQGAGDVGIHPGPGGKTLIDFLLLEPAEFVFTSIFNPAVSMPNLKEVRKNLKRMFLVQGIPYFNATSEYADLILPTPLLIERTGTITNGENLVRPVKQVLEPPENAKQDWEIMNALGKRLGIDLGFHDIIDVTTEISKKVPRYGKIRPELFYGDSWYDQFVEIPVEPKFVDIKPTLKEFPDYPYRLTTARRLPQFNTGDLTNKSERLNAMYSSRAVLISEKDALREKLRDGELVELISPVGKLEAKIKIGYSKVPEGRLIGVFHFDDFPINELTPNVFDEETKIPNYKSVPVKIGRLTSS